MSGPATAVAQSLRVLLPLRRPSDDEARKSAAARGAAYGVILLSEAAGHQLDYMVELQHALAESGHATANAPKSMVELGMDVERIARLVAQTEADAWVVGAGSREVLEWFSKEPVPAFALFGRRNGLLIPAVGPDKRPTYVAAVRELARLGHRRIVLMARSRRLLPEPGAAEQAFLDALAAQGLEASPYNLPVWEETTEGFHARLDSLFRLTPPTALIIDKGPLFAATQQFLPSGDSGCRRTCR